jgi:isocitrate dehydrogenase
VPPAVIESICHNKVCIKGELATPIDDGVSLNM